MPAICSVGLLPDKVICGNVPFVLFRWNAPPPAPVFGVSTRPAVLPLALMLALTLMSWKACSVSVALDAQLTAALTLISPGSVPLPLAVCSVMVPLVPSRLDDRVSAPMPDASCAPAPALMLKSVGSISHEPPWPAAPRVSTRVPPAMRTPAAEVSMLPPRPCSLLALIVPAMSARPCSRSPLTTMRPPDSVPAPSAVICPLVATRSPVIQISPLRSTSELARIRPVLLTSDEAMASAERAVSVTLPPSAAIRPLFSTVPATPGAITADSSPLPLMLTVAARPEASTTEPAFTVISPSLATRLPNSARYPPEPALSRPWLRTEPVPPTSRKTRRPSAKSCCDRSSVEATRPPTSTLAPGANSTPFGLVRNTCPLALRRP